MNLDVGEQTADLAAALGRRYAIERELGRGGMGIVYLARDLTLDRPVALKTLPADLAADPRTRERFLREAKTAAHLSHPNIVPIYHADEIDGHAFFAMAYVDGESLAQRLTARGPLPPSEAVRYLKEVAWALAYAHARGVIHRDIKPENILIERGSGRALVTDFGIARDGREQGITLTGNVLGTVHYMSPEQAAGDFLDGRSDLYALGVVGYYILSGVFPFDSSSASAILVAHVTRDAPPLSSVAPSVPQRLGSVIDRSLSKDPVERYPTGEDLAEALDDALALAHSKGITKKDFDDLMLSKQHAAILWRHAAQLQAEALRRLDTAHIERSLASTMSSEMNAAGQHREGYKLRQVHGAAVEAGISEQFLRLALAELPSESHDLAALETARWQERSATRLLGTRDRSCAVTRIVTTPTHRALQALGLTLQQAPWELTLKDPVGGHPLDGGVLVFDLPLRAAGMRMGYNMSFAWLGLRHRLAAKQVQVTLRAAPGDPSSTEVSMYADLRPGVLRNVNAASWWAGIAGVAGSGLGASLGAKLFAGVVALTTGISAVVVGAAAVVLAIGTYRASYRSAVARGREEMGRALDAVTASLRSQSLFGTAPRRQLTGPLRRSDNDPAVITALER
jgi:predicted Ser/Thr protein kinase